MTLRAYRRVAIVAPAGATGGPEAIHQFAHALNQIGVDAYLAYVGSSNRLEVTPDVIICHPPGHRPTMEYYKNYSPRVTREIPIDADTLVVIPEVFTNIHTRFRRSGVAIWWLSVDNAISNRPELSTESGRRALFGRDDLIHFHQSVYARDWLRKNDARRLYDLGDYTSDIFLTSAARKPSPSPFASYNSHKGADHAERFFKQAPEFQALGLRNFTKPQLRDIFSERLIYVDFGHFPGKDRMAREAAISGSVVFIQRLGAAANSDDFALADFFKFDPNEVDSGELRRRLEMVVAEPGLYWSQQAHFRALIESEKSQFYDQVRRHWELGRGP
jgi:hypothetical protein